MTLVWLGLARAICVPTGLEVEPGWVIDGFMLEGSDLLSPKLSVTHSSAVRGRAW